MSVNRLFAEKNIAERDSLFKAAAG